MGDAPSMLSVVIATKAKMDSHQRCLKHLIKN